MIGKAIIGAFVVCLALPAAAQDRALLVVVGDYPQPFVDLPGAARDLAMAREIALMLGFIEVRRLVDPSLAEIHAGLDWLDESRAANGRGLFYFSGHGSRVPDVSGDETDDVDEVLVPADVAIVRTNEGQRALSPVLHDDELRARFSRWPVGTLLAVIDACHSATSTERFVERESSRIANFVPKAISYRDMPALRQSVPSVGDLPDFITFAAAQDDQLALSNADGSLFTRAIHRLLREEGATLTWREASDRASTWIAERAGNAMAHRPSLRGSMAFSVIPFGTFPAALDAQSEILRDRVRQLGQDLRNH